MYRFPVLSVLALLPLVAPLTACPPATGPDAGDGDGDGDAQDLDQHGCDHMEFGPAMAVTASADEETAPTVMTGHRRLDITLPIDDGEDYAGAVRLEVPETGPVNLYFDTDRPITVKDASGATVAPTSSGPLDLCGDVALRVIVDLPAEGGLLVFEPAPGDLARVVARTPNDDGMHMHGEDGGHHGHDGGHHSHHDAGHHDLDGGAPSALAVAYCDCVFLQCHDGYHARWGEDELAAREACLSEADALPEGSAGDTAGNTLQCRLGYCEVPDGGAVDCPTALVENDTCQED